MNLNEELMKIIKKTTDDFEEGMEDKWDKIEIPMKVAVHRKNAEKWKDKLISILKELPRPNKTGMIYNYINVGAIVGGQNIAFRLFALGEFLGLWRIQTPQRLGFSSKEANRMCGYGGIGPIKWVSD